MTHPTFRLNQYAYAHRGLWDDTIPENSLTAFQAAAQAGFGAECDVHLSADGTPMVFHDFDLQRMCGRPETIASLTANELTQDRLMDSEGTIPTLAACLAAMKGLPMLVELKSAGEATDREALARAVLETLTNHPGPTAVMSFDGQLVKLIRAMAPDLMLGLLLEPVEPPNVDNLRDFCADCRIDFIGPQAIHMQAGRAAADALDLQVASWTLRQPDLLTMARSTNIGPIFEKLDPDLVRRTLST